MHTGSKNPGNSSPAVGHARGARLFITLFAICGVSALILYLHGATWWYMPLAAPLLVFAHIILIGGLAALAMLISSGRFGHSGRGAHMHGGESMTLHRPRLYDWQVRAMTFGGDGRLRRWILDLAGLKAGDKILDVGCGTGSLLLLAAERVGPSGALCGIERSAEMAAHARRKADARNVRLEIVESSADHLPYPPASFDVVFCTLVLHHLPAPMREAAIRGLVKALRPGGRVVFAELQRPRTWAAALADSLALAAALHGFTPGTEPSHVLDIEPLMAELGFEDIKRHPFGSGSVEALVGRLDGGKRADDRAGDLTRADG